MSRSAGTYSAAGESSRLPSGWPGTLAALVVAAGIGVLIAAAPLPVALFVLAAAAASIVALLRPEVALYALMAAVILTTETIDEEFAAAGGFPPIPDLKLMQGVPPATVAALLALGALYFVRRFAFQGRPSVVPLRYLIPYALLLALALGTGLGNGAAPEEVKNDLIRFVYPALCFYLCVNLLDDGKKIRTMLWVLFAACALRCTLLDLNYLTGNGQPYDFSTVVTLDSGLLMASGIMVSLVLALIVAGRWPRPFPVVLLALLPMVFALVFSFRRGHWVGQIAAGLLLYLWSFRDARRKLALAALLCALVASGSYLAAGGGEAPGEERLTLAARLGSIFNPSQHSNRHHFEESAVTLKDLSARPLLGMGLGGTHSPVPGAWRAEDQPLHVVHNTFLYLWMKLGLAGISLLVVGGGVYLRRVHRFLRSAPASPLRDHVVGIGSGAGIWLCMFATGPVPWYLHQSFLVALFAALCLNLMRLDPSGSDVPGRCR
ncbi:O-antigen ligase family protein [Geomesophilobacter sediminis]|uniref:O-antigen ligase-related domain-containing protein n=1 Tax=Geomesophilobacter sediminis TaxID=2798584 RepID=A0A8J7JDH5_9BACT|nr:O-antigen ligase family protein [Geomesophilobacter sediminis]MBJ6725361.1 hypothetical protein [Geomesophilobacter sediminis]